MEIIHRWIIIHNKNIHNLLTFILKDVEVDVDVVNRLLKLNTGSFCGDCGIGCVVGADNIGGLVEAATGCPKAHPSDKHDQRRYLIFLMSVKI